MYAVHGALVFYVSLDVRRFLPVVKCISLLGIAFGMGMIALDVAVAMPWYWILGEGPLIAILGGVLLWLASGLSKKLL